MIEVVVPERLARGEWARLAERGGNVFSTPEWCETWRAELAPHADA